MATLSINRDPLGAAVRDYFRSKLRISKIKVFSDIGGKETINPAYFLRSYKKMPYLEQLALQQCTGKILDVGACAGSHSLFLQNKGFSVTALDISEECCKIIKIRGVKNVACVDFLSFDGKFDTILLLMNGIGIAGTMQNLNEFLIHAKSLLNPDGQIIFDSSDISYAYSSTNDVLNQNVKYYGEVTYKLRYKNTLGRAFNWLFIDSKTMRKNAEKAGFKFDILAEGKHYDYLGILKLI